jgi:outer membrane lipoprotein carrier protein
MNRVGAASLGLFVLTSLPVSGQAPPTVHDLVARVQGHFDSVRDFKADFTQVYQGGIVKRTLTSTGEVRIKKPSRMWWRYVKPEKHDFVADGVDIIQYDPADNSYSTTPMANLDENSTSLLFLSGRGNLVADFTAALPASHPAGQWQIDLKPKLPQGEFTDVTLRVNRRSYAIEGLVTRDPQGGTNDFRFTNLRENNGLTDGDFVFRIPKGAVRK